MSSQLVMHCGARPVSRAELNAVTVPEATETYRPVSHGETLAIVERSLAELGFAVRQERHALTRGEARFFSVLDLESRLADGVGLSVGIRNSIDKSLPLGFAAGSRVFVCDNLAFRSELTTSARHTKNGSKRFRESIVNAVAALEQFAAGERMRIQVMQSLPVSNQVAESLILRAYEREVISSPLVLDVLHEWRQPSYPDFEARTAWSLFNAFTFALKGVEESNPNRYRAATMALNDLFDLTHQHT